MRRISSSHYRLDRFVLNARQLRRNFSCGSGGKIKLSEDLSRDKNGDITQATDLAGGPRSKTPDYDALNRLTSASANGLWGTNTYPFNNLLLAVPMLTCTTLVCERVSGREWFAYMVGCSDARASRARGGRVWVSYPPCTPVCRQTRTIPVAASWLA